MSGEGGAAALKGLRFLTVDRGPDGFGFHMYTNKTLKGQYVKWVSPNGPADLAGLLPGDHVLQVDGISVTEDTHQQVVEKIREGSGKGKTLLVIDSDTEKEMAEKGEEPVAANALVMISRAPTQTTNGSEGGPPLQPNPPPISSPEATEAPVSPLPLDMSAALPPKKNTKRAQVKNRDWRSSIQAYNEL